VADFFAALFYGLPNSVQEHFIGERLDQKLERAGFQRLYGRLDIGATTHENDLYLRMIADETLQLESVRAWQVQVEKEATGCHGSRQCHKLRSRGRHSGLPSRVSDHRFERITRRGIAVDDVYGIGFAIGISYSINIPDAHLNPPPLLTVFAK
jgi:hypothetical protein